MMWTAVRVLASMRLCRVEHLEQRNLLSAAADGVILKITRLNDITGVYVAYDDSSFEDPAIATDKTPLATGETATGSNYTSYDKGINGIVVDVFEVPDEAVIDATDFVFRVGNTDEVHAWEIAPEPIAIGLVEDAGKDGADRISIRWEDNAIQNEWLQIQVLLADFDLQATFDFDPAQDDAFFIGNLIGENTGDFKVDYDDVFNNIWPSLFTPGVVGIDNPADVNRDQKIDYDDVYDVVWPNLFGETLSAITPSNVDLVMHDRICLSTVISKIQAQQRADEEARFEGFAGTFDLYQK